MPQTAGRRRTAFQVTSQGRAFIFSAVTSDKKIDITRDMILEIKRMIHQQS